SREVIGQIRPHLVERPPGLTPIEPVDHPPVGNGVEWRNRLQQLLVGTKQPSIPPRKRVLRQPLCHLLKSNLPPHQRPRRIRPGPRPANTPQHSTEILQRFLDRRIIAAYRERNAIRAKRPNERSRRLLDRAAKDSAIARRESL